ncbi:hypothetical protein J6590_007414 [Homalodisca vitripennis]|nr:hypothetical protein J6590_007414 [Homalodisca vitripennis]
MIIRQCRVPFCDWKFLHAKASVPRKSTDHVVYRQGRGVVGGERRHDRMTKARGPPDSRNCSDGQCRLYAQIRPLYNYWITEKASVSMVVRIKYSG